MENRNAGLLTRKISLSEVYDCHLKVLSKWGGAPSLLARPRDILPLKTMSQILVFFVRFFEVLVKRS
jgi:hypothetical protein